MDVRCGLHAKLTMTIEFKRELKIWVLIFMAGMSWASLMWKEHDRDSKIEYIRSTIEQVNSRLSKVEHYITTQSKGQWQPDPPPVPNEDSPK
jgi:hypothetical protein